MKKIFAVLIPCLIGCSALAQYPAPNMVRFGPGVRDLSSTNDVPDAYESVRLALIRYARIRIGVVDGTPIYPVFFDAVRSSTPVEACSRDLMDTREIVFQFRGERTSLHEVKYQACIDRHGSRPARLSPDPMPDSEKIYDKGGEIFSIVRAGRQGNPQLPYEDNRECGYERERIETICAATRPGMSFYGARRLNVISTSSRTVIRSVAPNLTRPECVDVRFFLAGRGYPVRGVNVGCEESAWIKFDIELLAAEPQSPPLKVPIQTP